MSCDKGEAEHVVICDDYLHDRIKIKFRALRSRHKQTFNGDQQSPFAADSKAGFYVEWALHYRDRNTAGQRKYMYVPHLNPWSSLLSICGHHV